MNRERITVFVLIIALTVIIFSFAMVGKAFASHGIDLSGYDYRPSDAHINWLRDNVNYSDRPIETQVSYYSTNVSQPGYHFQIVRTDKPVEIKVESGVLKYRLTQTSEKTTVHQTHEHSASGDIVGTDWKTMPLQSTPVGDQWLGDWSATDQEGHPDYEEPGPAEPIIIDSPEANTTVYPDELVFRITETWPEGTGLHLIQRHINGTEKFLMQMTPTQVIMYTNGLPITAATKDIIPGETHFIFFSVNSSGALSNESVFVYEMDYNPTGLTSTGITAVPSLKFYRDIDSNADTSEVYILLTDYYAAYNETGKAVPGDLDVLYKSTYDSDPNYNNSKTFKYPSSNIFSNWYYGWFGMPDAGYYSFQQRIYVDTDSQHNLIGDLTIWTNFYPEGQEHFIQHKIVIPAGYNPFAEGRDNFVHEPINTDTETPDGSGNFVFDETNQTRTGFEPLEGISQHVDKATHKMLEKLSLGPLQQTFAQIEAMSTEQGTAPVFTVNLNSLVAVGQNIHGQTSGGFAEPEATLIDFAILEDYSYAGFTMIGLVRALITFGMVFMTIMYIWRKIEGVTE